MANWQVTTAAARLEFDTQNNSYNRTHQIDSNHFINFCCGVDTDGFVQVFAVDTTTWAVTTAAAALEFDTQNNTFNRAAQIDSNHFINFWMGLDNDGYVQVFAVNTTTWEVTTAGAALEYDTGYSNYFDCYAIDSTHFILFWRGVDDDGFAQVFAVNTTTWEVTTAAAWLEFDTQNCIICGAVQIDSNHFLNFWQGTGSDGFAQVFTVNTTTWEVTTAGAALLFEATTCYMSKAFPVGIDGAHFINFWSGDNADGYVQVFAVNTTTWEVTTAAAALEYDTWYSNWMSGVQIDSNHYIHFWRGEGDDGYAQVFTVTVPAPPGEGQPFAKRQIFRNAAGGQWRPARTFS